MRQLVIVCPVCGDSIIVAVVKGDICTVGFNSRCGTTVEARVDCRFETETARIAALKERAASERNEQQS